MPEGGTAAFGTTISINSTPIGGVQDISGPNDSYDWSDTTSHSSPNRTEEGVPTIRRTGEVTFTVVRDGSDAGQAALLAAHDAIAAGGATPDSYVITYPDGATDSFDGWCMRFGRGAPVGGHLAAEVAIRPTGAVTYVGAS